MFWENFNRLCNSRGVTPNGVAKELGIPSGSVTDWKKGRTPRSATQIKIADYFGVSVNALNGNPPTIVTFPRYDSSSEGESISNSDSKPQFHAVVDIPPQDIPKAFWNVANQIAEQGQKSSNIYNLLLASLLLAALSDADKDTADKNAPNIQITEQARKDRIAASAEIMAKLPDNDYDLLIELALSNRKMLLDLDEDDDSTS